MPPPIQFYEYDDRIELQNSDGLYGKVSPDNFPNGSDYRNPFIAEALITAFRVVENVSQKYFEPKLRDTLFGVYH